MISVHFKQSKTTFSCVVYAIFQCKKNGILEPNRTLIVVEPEPNPSSRRTRTETEPCFQILDKNPNRAEP